MNIEQGTPILDFRFFSHFKNLGEVDLNEANQKSLTFLTNEMSNLCS